MCIIIAVLEHHSCRIFLQQGELTYRMGTYNVHLVGKIAREPQQGKWTIRDGVFSVEAANNAPRLFGEEQ